jgi:hypothetical protein
MVVATDASRHAATVGGGDEQYYGEAFIVTPSGLANASQKLFGIHEFELHGKPIVQKFQ